MPKGISKPQRETSPNDLEVKTPTFELRAITQPVHTATAYENTLKQFLALEDKDQGRELTGTQSDAMHLVQAKRTLKLPIRISWDKPTGKGEQTTIQLMY